MGAGLAMFFDNIRKDRLKTIWQTEIIMEGEKYKLRNVALEGYIWYASKDGSKLPKLGGRFRKEQPKYCTLFEISDSESFDYFLNRSGRNILIEDLNTGS